MSYDELSLFTGMLIVLIHCCCFSNLEGMSFLYQKCFSNFPSPYFRGCTSVGPVVHYQPTVHWWLHHDEMVGLQLAGCATADIIVRARHPCPLIGGLLQYSAVIG